VKTTLNYTGRKRIEREMISINVTRHNGQVVCFILNKLDVQGLALPPDAKVRVEAYYRTELKAFEFGTVANITPPLSTDLTDMAYRVNLKFRILVVDPSDKKVLAHADRIVPDEPAERKPILDVEFKDLGNQMWQVEYEGDEGRPVLCINKSIPEEIARRDAQFMVHVYFAVLKEILTYMVFVEEVTSVEEPAVEWHTDWLQFSRNLGITPPEVLDHAEQGFDKDKALEWINEVVAKFSDTLSSKFAEYLQKLGGAQ
jgi:hypothetical protein